jgi:hypothetical protein
VPASVYILEPDTLARWVHDGSDPVLLARAGGNDATWVHLVASSLLYSPTRTRHHKQEEKQARGNTPHSDDNHAAAPSGGEVIRAFRADVIDPSALGRTLRPVKPRISATRLRH